jgi:hypothetical protein
METRPTSFWFSIYRCLDSNFLPIFHDVDGRQLQRVQTLQTCTCRIIVLYGSGVVTSNTIWLLCWAWFWFDRVPKVIGFLERYVKFRYCEKTKKIWNYIPLLLLLPFQNVLSLSDYADWIIFSCICDIVICNYNWKLVLNWSTFL